MSKETVVKFRTTFRRALPHEKGIEFRGIRYVVGEPDKFSDSPKTVERLADFSGLFALKVKEMVNSPDIRYVFTTMPLETCVKEARGQGKNIQTLKDSVKEALGKETEVFVEPQGILGLEALIQQRKLVKAPTLLIDGGFNTVNLLLVREDLTAPVMVSYYNRGVSRLIEIFGAILQNKGVASNLSISQLQETFLEGSLDMGTEEVPVEEEKKASLDFYVEELLSEILDLIRARGERFKQVAVVGGISYYLKSLPDYFKGKRVYVPEEGGEYLNLLGLVRKAEKKGQVENSLIFDLGFGFVKYYRGEEQ